MIIDIENRTTTNFNEFDKFKKSSESLVFIDSINVKDKGSCCLNFTVGDRWLNQANSQWYQLPEKGIVLKPKESITIETKERLAVPLNVFGLVTGLGRNIYNGGMVSTGKIDPGFNGKLRIGFFNASGKKKIIKKDDSLCTTFFMQTETGIPNALTEYIDESQNWPNAEGFSIIKFLKLYWDKLVPMLLALLSLSVAIWVAFFK
ncbi:deoxycytidine triphosphate deaminase [Mycobacteroides abscessus subsp. abscessus]|nr:deoxycytidine triphosphate deaminase [Mycobacteroides abscessus subsp. abscessus]